MAHLRRAEDEQLQSTAPALRRGIQPVQPAVVPCCFRSIQRRPLGWGGQPHPVAQLRSRGLPHPFDRSIGLILRGLWYSGTILSILGCHELGHYFACRYYDVDASLPYFLPLILPSPIQTGTLGACAGLVHHVHPLAWCIASLLFPSKRK